MHLCSNTIFIKCSAYYPFGFTTARVVPTWLSSSFRTRAVYPNGAGCSSSPPGSTCSQPSSSLFLHRQLSRSYDDNVTVWWCDSNMMVIIWHKLVHPLLFLCLDICQGHNHKWKFHPHYHPLHNCYHHHLGSGVQLQVLRGDVHSEVLHLWRFPQLPGQSRTPNTTSISAAATTIINLKSWEDALALGQKVWAKIFVHIILKLEQSCLNVQN